MGFLQRHRRAGRLGLLAVSSVLALIAAEWLARWRRPELAPDARPLAERLAESAASLPDEGPGLSLRGLVRPSCNSRLIFELKPGLRATFQGVPLEVNEHGHRGAARPRAKPLGTVRVLGIGDSVLFGWGVREDETFLSGLERRLNASGERPHEVLNFGVPGYNTMQEATQLEAVGLGWAPDAVVVCFVHNDDQLPGFVARTDGGLLDASVLARLLLRGRGQPEQRPESYSDFWSEPQNVPPEYRSMVGAEGVEQGLQRIGFLARVHGFGAYLFAYGAPRPMTRQVYGWCEQYGIEVLDLQAYLERRGLAYGPELRLSEADPHPSSRFHGEIADFLHEALSGRLAR
jgi:hypothetical protein